MFELHAHVEAVQSSWPISRLGNVVVRPIGWKTLVQVGTMADRSNGTVPQHVWARNLVLPTAEKVILYTLVSHASGKTTCFPGLATLADETGLHRATVIRRPRTARHARALSASTDAPEGTTSTTFSRPNPSHRTTGRRALPVAQGDG